MEAESMKQQSIGHNFVLKDMENRLKKMGVPEAKEGL